MAKNILETAAVIIGSLGKNWIFISRKLGQGDGKFVIIEATTDSGSAVNPKETAVIVGERNNGMNWINDSSTAHKLRVVRFGSRGSLIV